MPKDMVRSMVTIRAHVRGAEPDSTFDMIEDLCGIDHQLSKQVMLGRLCQLAKVDNGLQAAESPDATGRSGPRERPESSSVHPDPRRKPSITEKPE